MRRKRPEGNTPETELFRGDLALAGEGLNPNVKDLF